MMSRPAQNSRNAVVAAADSLAMLEGIGSSRPARYDEDQDDDRPTDPQGYGTRPSQRSDAFDGRGVDAHVDAGLAAFVRNQAADDILHVGINRSSSGREVAVLKSLARVTSLGGGAGAGRDLAAALRARGLGKEQADGVAAVIASSREWGKEMLTELALAWAAGERGGTVPGRLVLSGHSNGELVWDEAGASVVDLADVRRLARAMPRAAAQIEDLHLSACSTGGQAGIEETRTEWLDAFPNLRTIWAYGRSAPLAGGTHLAEWARATKGPADQLALTGKRAKENVGVWDRVGGYRDASGPLSAARARQREADARFTSWTTAARAPAGDGDPALVADYRTYRALAMRSDLSRTERDACRIKAEQLLRLRYFEGAVRREIDARHGATLARGYRALGLEPPAFRSLSFREALDRIDAFEQARAAGAAGAGANGGAHADIERARRILAGIRALDSVTIHAEWCRH